MVSDISEKGVSLIAYYECSGDPDNPKWLKAYLDSGSLPTIGIGTIQYPNGKAVKMGDVITREQEYEYFKYEVRNKVSRVNFYTTDDIKQNQFDTLISLAYNIGSGKGGLQTSTVLKLVNKDLLDINIANAFLSWRYDNGQEVPGLIRRRMSEAFYYFTGILKYDWRNYRKYSQLTLNEVLFAINSVEKI